MKVFMDRLFVAFERGFDESQKNRANMVRDNVRDGIRAVVDELAKADVSEAMPTVDELQKAYTDAAIATCESRHTTGARITDIPKAGYMAIANLVAGRINPVIVALRARVAELEAHIASRMPYPDIHIAASPDAINEALADEPIADPAERARKVAEILCSYGVSAAATDNSSIDRKWVVAIAKISVFPKTDLIAFDPSEYDGGPIAIAGAMRDRMAIEFGSATR